MTSTIILGAGIIGVSTAYYLSEHQPGSTIHLVDPSEKLFSSASGYAGGFLAKDWYQPSVSSLGALSFEQHRLLAEKHGGREKWKYAPSTAISYSPGRREGGKSNGADWLMEGSSRAGAAGESVGDLIDGVEIPAWLNRAEGDEVEALGAAEGDTAQVEPLLLCQWLLEQCRERGVQMYHPATAISISMDVRDQLSSVRIADVGTSTETDIPATRLIIAAGAWSGRVFASLFKNSRVKIPVSSLAGHSLVVSSPRWKGSSSAKEKAGCHAVFTSGASYSPEIFSRVNGEIYIAGLNSSTIPLPDVQTGFTKPDPACLATIEDTAKQLLGQDAVEVVREGLCFRPVTPAGTPIIARVKDEDLGIGIRTRPGADGGVFVATGHGPWGISLSLGTGIAIAEMVQGRAATADISGLGRYW
jgi:glycine/D-amino acid oxidase-like deaminating enzyme